MNGEACLIGSSPCECGCTYDGDCPSPDRPHCCINDDYKCHECRPTCDASRECSSFSCYDYSSGSCSLKTYYCFYSNEGYYKWDTSYPSTETNCKDDHDNDCDNEDEDCKDSDCAGKPGPNNVICCQDESDCSSLSSECKPYKPECRSDNTCGCKESCTQNSHCVENACCRYVISSTLEKICDPEGTIIDYGGKSYLCDPPGWSVGKGKQETSENSIFDLVINFFSGIFG